jgi:hypothetical protein
VTQKWKVIFQKNQDTLLCITDYEYEDDISLNEVFGDDRYTLTHTVSNAACVYLNGWSMRSLWSSVECLWQFQAPTLTGCMIVPFGCFIDQKLQKDYSYWMKDRFLHAFKSTHIWTAQQKRENWGQDCHKMGGLKKSTMFISIVQGFVPQCSLLGILKILIHYILVDTVLFQSLLFLLLYYTIVISLYPTLSAQLAHFWM